jgi:hypothetical protein
MSNPVSGLVAKSLHRRKRKIVIILGEPGMGKSALAKYIVSIYEGQVLILDPGHNWRKAGLGEYPSAAYKNPKMLELWLNIDASDNTRPRWDRFTNRGGLFVADDADLNMIPKGDASTNWRFLWMINRHLNGGEDNGGGVDVVIITHIPQGIPPLAYAMANEIICFRIDEKNAVDHLKETSLKEYIDEIRKLPKGSAIRYQKDPPDGVSKFAKVNYFQVLPKPAEVEKKLLQRFRKPPPPKRTA